MRLARVELCALVALGLSCVQEGDTGTDTDTDETDTGTPDWPCPDACFPGDHGEDAIYVCPEGTEEGDGSRAAPFSKVEDALEATREEGAPGVVLVGSGAYLATLDVHTLTGDASDDGLTIAGCGPDEVALVAADADEPVIKVSGSQDVTLSGLALMGGARTLWVWQGASVEVDDLLVENGIRLGIVIDGSTTLLTAEGLEVRDIQPDASGNLGYGIAIQNASAHLVDTRVENTHTVGILVTGHDASDVRIEDAVVTGTSADDEDQFGRGLMVQEWSQAIVVDGEFSDNHDAGIFGLKASYLEVDGAVVDVTLAAAIPDEASTTSGDGLVIGRGSTNTDPSSFDAVVTGATVTGSARSGIALAGVTVHGLSGNSLTDNGYDIDGVSIFVQDGADVRDADPDDHLELAEAQELPFNNLLADVEDFSDER